MGGCLNDFLCTGEMVKSGEIHVCVFVSEKTLLIQGGISYQKISHSTEIFSKILVKGIIWDINIKGWISGMFSQSDRLTSFHWRRSGVFFVNFEHMFT